MKKLSRFKTFGGDKEMTTSINLLIDAVNLLATKAGLDLSVLEPDEIVIAGKPFISGGEMPIPKKTGDTIEFIPERKSMYYSSTDLQLEERVDSGGETVSDVEVKELEEIVKKSKSKKTEG